jgi:hypothetical protein
MASSNIFLLHHACFADAQSSQDAGQEKNNFLDDAQCVCIVIFSKFYLWDLIDDSWLDVFVIMELLSL